MHTHACTHTYMHTTARECTHTHTRTHTHEYAHTHTRIEIQTCSQLHTYMLKIARIRAHACTRKHNTHTQARTQIYAHSRKLYIYNCMCNPPSHCTSAHTVMQNLLLCGTAGISTYVFVCVCVCARVCVCVFFLCLHIHANTYHNQWSPSNGQECKLQIGRRGRGCLDSVPGARTLQI